MTSTLPDRPSAADLRIGDAEREAAVTALGEHFVAGRLDSDEFDARTSAAYAARFRRDIDALFRDLPTPRPGGSAERQPAGAAHVPVFFLLVVLGLVLAVAYGFPPVFPLLAVLWFASRRRRAWR